MTNETVKKTNPIHATTPESIRLAKTLIRQARFGSLAVMDPATGGPGVSRVAVAPDITGAPIILVSRLSAHTKALLQDPRCSILLGEPGKGDPLAHPRISVTCRAEFLEPANAETGRAAARFLRRNPKAKLYAGFADFSFVRLTPVSASLNGGFGQAYHLAAGELLSPDVDTHANAFDELEILNRLNGKDAKLLSACIAAETGKSAAKCMAVTVDSEGVDVVLGANFQRIWFASAVSTQDKLFDLLLKFQKTP